MIVMVLFTISDYFSFSICSTFKFILCITPNKDETKDYDSYYQFHHVYRLPVRWDKTTIVVMNEVRVSSPYLPESVVGGTPAANERVRKVVRLSTLKVELC